MILVSPSSFQAINIANFQVFWEVTLPRCTLGCESRQKTGMCSLAGKQRAQRDS